MPHRKRIAFILRSMYPYRTTFYEKLNSHQEYEWLFFYGIKEEEDGRPAYQGKLNFPNQPLRNLNGRIGPFAIRWQLNLFQMLRKWRPDVIIMLGFPSMINHWLIMYWASRRNIKIIVWFCGWESQAGNPFSLHVKWRILQKYMHLADNIIAYSTKTKSYLKNLGILPEKVVVGYNGLEIDHLLENEKEYLEKGRALRDQNEQTGKKVFLYVGGMIAEKQVPLLLNAFRAINTSENAVLWLVGDGPDLNMLKNMAEGMNLKGVKFWGRVIEGVDVFFAAADFFVLPGVGGLSLNQALFWRLPCVVSEADGTEDDLVWDGKTGFRFTPMDLQSLEKALSRCLELHESARLDFGNTGRRLVLERSNVNQMVNTFLKTIEQDAAS